MVDKNSFHITKSFPDIKDLLIQDAECCYKYSIVAFLPVGNCRLCGERPKVLGNPRIIDIPIHPMYLSPYFLGTFYGQ